VVTLIDDDCTCTDHPGQCNFSAVGDTCRAAVLAPLKTGQPGQLFQVLPTNALEPPQVPPEYAAPLLLDLHASISLDGKALSVRVVNPTDKLVDAQIDLTGFHATTVRGTVLTSASRLDDNPPDDPMRISPKPLEAALANATRSGAISFAPNSFNVLQFS
jgi:hypothetical protein